MKSMTALNKGGHFIYENNIRDKNNEVIRKVDCNKGRVVFD